MFDFKTAGVGLLATFGGFIASLNIASDVLKFLTLLTGAVIGSISLWKILSETKTKKKK